MKGRHTSGRAEVPPRYVAHRKVAVTQGAQRIVGHLPFTSVAVEELVARVEGDALGAAPPTVPPRLSWDEVFADGDNHNQDLLQVYG